jgi:CDP-glucose 4,6-dehydratase
MFSDVFRDKRVLLTGHTGFKGSWLGLWLHDLGSHVTGLALEPDTDPAHFDLIDLGSMVQHVVGDIRDVGVVARAFDGADPEVVIHMAAQPLVLDSYDDPKTTFDTNVGGTVNVLEAVRRSKSVRAALIITSDKCYENREWVWGYRERDAMGGHDPYSASKGAAEIVCAGYRRSFFASGARGPHVGVATARAGNVIGGGDWAKDRLIPDCVRALSRGEPICIRNKHATRPWQHVLEPLSGYLTLVHKLLENPDAFAGAWNFGPADGEHVTVADTAKLFVGQWGDGTVEFTPEADAPHEAHLLRLVIDKAAYDLGWQPVLDTRTAIDWTAGWYKQWNRGGADLRTLSRSRIREYVERAEAKGLAWVK